MENPFDLSKGGVRDINKSLLVCDKAIKQKGVSLGMEDFIDFVKYIKDRFDKKNNIRVCFAEFDFIKANGKYHPHITISLEDDEEVIFHFDKFIFPEPCEEKYLYSDLFDFEQLLRVLHELDIEELPNYKYAYIGMPTGSGNFHICGKWFYYGKTAQTENTLGFKTGTQPPKLKNNQINGKLVKSVKEKFFPDGCNICHATPNEIVFVPKDKKGIINKWSIWKCSKCLSRVGCHYDEIFPLGILADQQLRSLRKEFHKRFDPIWKWSMAKKGYSKKEARNKAYYWLSKRMNLDISETHASTFYKPQIKVANFIIKKFIKDNPNINFLKNK